MVCDKGKQKRGSEKKRSMDKSSALFLGFVSGSVIGAFVSNIVTTKLIKDKYKKESDEVIGQFIRNNFHKVMNEPVKEEPNKSEEKLSNMRDYTKLTHTMNYIKPENEQPKPTHRPPYPIREEDLNTKDYDDVALTRYSDGVIVNAELDIVPAEILPDDVDKMFSEETEVIYIRNDELGSDYTIVSDPRTYNEVMQEVRY